MKWNKSTDRQKLAAKSFSARHATMSISQCMKYLDEIFRYLRGEITAAQFKAKTGWEVGDWK